MSAAAAGPGTGVSPDGVAGGEACDGDGDGDDGSAASASASRRSAR
ncbi:hypothetical protein P376_2343 [Streptomyces sp. HCCB10043]|nr:hypothetical protein P376_2343 [Streptomyces sp. HCCB10043]